MDSGALLKSTALELGFELVGVAEAGRPKTFDAFRRWIDAGMHAGMDYLARRKDAREDLNSVLPGARSVLMLGVSYGKVLGEKQVAAAQLAGVAEYARGVDYHDWIKARLKILSAKHRELFPEARCRGAVDTAPILERQWAVDAGLGFIGRNTMLIRPNFGSKIFLACLLSTERLGATGPSEFSDHLCGDCRRCLDACPTGALVEPFVLDARRCLNYWTIEHRGPIASEIEAKLDGRFFGCDTCQSVCPWNRDRPTPGTVDPKTLDEETLRNWARGTPLERRFH